MDRPVENEQIQIYGLQGCFNERVQHRLAQPPFLHTAIKLELEQFYRHPLTVRGGSWRLIGPTCAIQANF